MLCFDIVANDKILHFHLKLLVFFKLIKTVCPLKNTLIHQIREHPFKSFNIFSHLTYLTVIKLTLNDYIIS